MQQITNTVLMIRPASFRSNEETMITNHFQKKSLPESQIGYKARNEFDNFVKQLIAVGVEVIVFDDIRENDTPDALFPNNWITFHVDGRIALYPMQSANRRRERRNDIIEELNRSGYNISGCKDYSHYESSDIFLEGTGSMVLDRENRKAYCALSPRSSETALLSFCEDFGYIPVAFRAAQSVGAERKPVYHTNVILTIGETFAVICQESIDNKKEREIVINSLKRDGKEIIFISEKQVSEFAGNMLQLKNRDEKHLLIMSTRARRSLSRNQLSLIEEHASLIDIPLDTIETHGGGSARCMMAELFLPRR
ncbi:MAG: arginine deiminase-related protein [Brumimicrobium sp.]|nr:arginine deiminase-related protein [Brumimicrobium sp.]